MLINKCVFHKYRFLSLFFKNEKGGILLPFIVLLPMFSGLLFLSFEISQFLQKKAKLSDAIEQATLALTVENNSIPDANQSQKNIDLVTHYATAYLPSEKFSTPIIDISNNKGHLLYKAETTMSYPAQFLANNPLANTKISMADSGAARKDVPVGPSELTDVVFVVDYSGSMNGSFDSAGGTTKIDALRNIFHRLNSHILKNDNINTIGFIPFSWGTKTIVGTGSQSTTYCHFPYAPIKHKSAGDYLRQYTASNLKQFLAPENYHLVDNIGYGELGNRNNRRNYLKIKDEISHHKSNLANEFMLKTHYINKNFIISNILISNIDYDKTIDLMSKKYKAIDIPIDDILDGNICLSSSTAYSLEFNKVSDNSITESLSIEPTGLTLVSSGILAANNLFKEANDKNKKLMIVLSDGIDSGTTTTFDKGGNIISIDDYIKNDEDKKPYRITKNLIDKGMCEAIADNQIRMVFIAIGYTPETNVKSPTYIDWEKCVGKDNFYQAKDAHELEADLQQVLGGGNIRDVGRNTPKH
ncbi:TadE/TadG family type IV pilus assembly protein [Yersinia mollaretii]|uniref:TadE/TadG family type IV pilus assembly protein n=1 Tax=Yersinia mollaretii TaxID=33060 RepID=UPI0005DBA6DA|nr:TadE/TadG family type IV pilus assembly protein [Yersinia mollaretii]MDA5528449.1 pilus assembly protein [Yersinia mollaretii]MDR7874416.1 pilus assembly protein [Yersinia mollaretii]PHZ32410.1 pilus assembly protein [Yersinia mollaretii]WQC74652.1 TadE/TadG family type IV pilus assembly protein [Yersinia mollaretii]CNE65989.1 putative tight adherance operon protein [Yersinia mollaretii]